MAANVKQRYVPIEAKMVPGAVKKEFRRDRWFAVNDDGWARLVHKDIESGVAFEFAAPVSSLAKSTMPKRWYVADGTSPTLSRSRGIGQGRFA